MKISLMEVKSFIELSYFVHTLRTLPGDADMSCRGHLSWIILISCQLPWNPCSVQVLLEKNSASALLALLLTF